MNRAAVDRVHRSVARLLREITTVRCSIGQLPQRRQQSEAMTFALMSGEDAAPLELVDRERGGRAPVIPFFPPIDVTDPTVWMSWYERWTRGLDGDFRVTNLSATFYWGVAYRKRKQLLRAEWDDDHSPETSAQPHWQVDTELTGEPYTATVLVAAPETSDSLVELPTRGDTGELVEITAIGLQEISLSPLHLGMGGWRNASFHPACWKYDVGADVSTFTQWADRTLRHAADQFKGLSVVTL